MRTLYDGQSFDIIRENEVFGGGDFTTNYSSGIEFDTGEATGGRYRYIEDGATGGRYRNVDGYIIEKTRFTGTKATLYANGESVGVNRFSNAEDSSGRAYFGTDILGSVRSATTDGASIEDRYEYDAFGTPYKGDFSTGLDNGYTGKPYDATTGLYNYGFRDYSPETARFTTVDPIRDGSNWFSYVVNDPVNYVDLWGLCTSDADATKEETYTLRGLAIGVFYVAGVGGESGFIYSEENEIVDYYLTYGIGYGAGYTTKITGSSNTTSKSPEELHGSTSTVAQIGAGGIVNYDVETGERTGGGGIGAGGGVLHTVTVTGSGIINDIKNSPLGQLATASAAAGKAVGKAMDEWWDDVMGGD